MRNRAISEAGWLTDGRCCILTNQSAAFCSCPDVPWTPQQLRCWCLPREFNVLRSSTFKVNAGSKFRSFSTCEKFHMSIISIMHALAKGDRRRNMLDRWILERGQDTDWHAGLGIFAAWIRHTFCNFSLIWSSSSGWYSLESQQTLAFKRRERAHMEAVPCHGVRFFCTPTMIQQVLPKLR